MPGDWWPADCQRGGAPAPAIIHILRLSLSTPRPRLSRSPLWPTRARGVKNRERRRLDGPAVVRHRRHRVTRERGSVLLESGSCLVLPLSFPLLLLLPVSQPLANRSILSRHPRVSAFYRIIKQSRVIRHTRFAGF